jgi:hypothetical protein
MRKEIFEIKMKNKRTIVILIMGGLIVAMTLGTIAYRSVLAAAPATVVTSSTNATTQANLSWWFGRGPNGGYTTEDLANALGITEDDLSTAFQSAVSAALKQAVSDGLITQAQADELISNGTAFPFGNRWDNWLTKNGIDFDTYLAESLDIRVDELRTAYQTAYYARIDQAVADGKLTEEQADLKKGQYALYHDSTFLSSIQSAFTSAVNAAVTSGVITQSQADQILNKSSNILMPGMDSWGGHHGSREGGNFSGNYNLP